MTSWVTQNFPVTFIDADARASRIAASPNELSAASFANGMNNGTCGSVIGINSGGGELNNDADFLDGISGDPSSWTLLDQNGAGAARSPQDGFSIGGTGYNANSNYPNSGGTGNVSTQPDTMEINAVQSAKDGDPALDGTVTANGGATLTTIAGGWVAGTVAPT
jgi:hypothetical protein